MGEGDRCGQVFLGCECDETFGECDILFLMGGIAHSVQHGAKEQARRLIDLIMDALTKDSIAS